MPVGSLTDFTNCGGGYFIATRHYGIAAGMAWEKTSYSIRLYLLFDVLPVAPEFRSLTFSEQVAEDFFGFDRSGRSVAPKGRNAVFEHCRERLQELRPQALRLRRPEEAYSFIENRPYAEPFSDAKGLLGASALMGNIQATERWLCEAFRQAKLRGMPERHSRLESLSAFGAACTTSDTLVAFARQRSIDAAGQLGYPMPTFASGNEW
jgi:hypothetical protein